MRCFIAGDSIGVGRGRAHAEFDGAFDQGEGLALAIQVPAPWTAVLGPELDQTAIRFGELR